MSSEPQGRVSIERLGDGRYKVTILGEDHSIGNLLAVTLIKLPEVEAASYMKPHPLEDKIFVFISLKDKNANVVDVIVKALELILEENKAFRSLYLEALKSRGVAIEA